MSSNPKTPFNPEQLEKLKRAVKLQRLQQQGIAAKKKLARPPLRLADRSLALPLSWAQQRLWFIDQLDHAAGAAYHIPAALRLSGALDIAALRRTLDRIVARHESLRTTFSMVGGEPVQIIAPADSGFALREVDFSEQSPEAQHRAVQERSTEEAAAPFDLASGPLIRGQLLRLSGQEHILLITQHHIISDGWSIGVLVEEVRALYTAFHQGQPDPLPPLAIQYADYAQWQREWLRGEALEKQTAFWKEHLGGAPTLLELPTDRPRPAVQSHAGTSVPVQLSAALTAAIKSFSQLHGVTPFMTLLAGWSILLSRLSGQRDVVIGTPVANRQRAEFEPLLGFFVNTLALRVRLEDEPTVADLLAQIKATTLAAYEHQDVPFEQIVEVLQPTRSLSHSPMFQVMLALNNTPAGQPLVLPELTLSALEQALTTTHFDLSLSLNDVDGAFSGTLNCATDLFDASTITRWLNYFIRTLSALVRDSSQRVSALEW